MTTINTTGIELEVCQDIAQRQQVGIKKYGVTVADSKLPLIEWLNHAYQESLDHAIYLKRAMKELRAGWTPASVSDLVPCPVPDPKLLSVEYNIERRHLDGDDMWDKYDGPLYSLIAARRLIGERRADKSQEDRVFRMVKVSTYSATPTRVEVLDQE